MQPYLFALVAWVVSLGLAFTVMANTPLTSSVLADALFDGSVDDDFVHDGVIGAIRHSPTRDQDVGGVTLDQYEIWLSTLLNSAEPQVLEGKRRQHRRTVRRQRIPICNAHSTITSHNAAVIKDSTISLLPRISDDEGDIVGADLDDRWKRSPPANSHSASARDWVPGVSEHHSCSEPPNTAVDSQPMDRALCPWEWRANVNEARLPRVVSEAHCLCRQARGDTADGGRLVAVCTPIFRRLAVRRLRRCADAETGLTRHEYVDSHETVSVGCHGVLPRKATAVPFKLHLLNTIRHLRHHGKSQHSAQQHRLLHSHDWRK